MLMNIYTNIKVTTKEIVMTKVDIARRNLLITSLSLFLPLSSFASPKISNRMVSSEFREAVQGAMLEHIDATAIDNGKHLIFDPVEGDWISARFDHLHEHLIEIKDMMYVSCADFIDDTGDILDIDFLVAKVDDYYGVIRTVIHKRKGRYREAHMEDGLILSID